MRFVAFTEFGGPEVVRIMERPVPVPGPGEVLVRVAASTVNPTDLLMRSGQQAALIKELVPPYVGGMEFSGHVQAIGAGVDSVAVGQAVMGVVNPRRPAGGAHAEYLVVPAASVAALAPSTDLVDAATIPMNGLTAIMALEALALPPGATLLVTGGPGAVGGYVIALARAQGLRPLSDGRPEDAPMLRALGADAVLPRGEDTAVAARALFPDGVDGMVDTALVASQVSRAVRDGGRAVSLRRSSPITDPRLTASYVGVLDRADDTATLERLSKLLADGVLRPRVAHRLPMDQARQAHELVARGGLRGRVVLTF
ncbi:MAG: NADP-dependent oxidoreductase [Rhodoferax sp.]|nr:NADP-dependent oxidoreductase [Rhodoferax sp.]